MANATRNESPYFSNRRTRTMYINSLNYNASKLMISLIHRGHINCFSSVLRIKDSPKQVLQAVNEHTSSTKKRTNLNFFTNLSPLIFIDNLY